MSLKQTEPTAGRERETVAGAEASPDEYLALLTADYTRAILEAIRSEPRSARAIAEEVGASRATVYRRLNSLEAVGLVDSELTYDSDGHHRTTFEATLERVTVCLSERGFSVAVATDG